MSVERFPLMQDLKFAVRQLLKNPGSLSTLRSAVAQPGSSSDNAAPGNRATFGSTATEDGPRQCLVVVALRFRADSLATLVQRVPMNANPKHKKKE